MALATLRKLSVSTDGAPIQIGATSTAGTTVHTAVTGTDDFDLIWIYLVNAHSADVVVNIEWGQVTAALNIVKTIVKDSGLTLVVDGLPLQNGKTVGIFAGTTNVIAAYGHVIRNDLA